VGSSCMATPTEEQAGCKEFSCSRVASPLSVIARDENRSLPRPGRVREQLCHAVGGRRTWAAIGAMRQGAYDCRFKRPDPSHLSQVVGGPPEIGRRLHEPSLAAIPPRSRGRAGRRSAPARRSARISRRSVWPPRESSRSLSPGRAAPARNWSSVLYTSNQIVEA
jgi:hypothetical protein